MFMLFNYLEMFLKSSHYSSECVVWKINVSGSRINNSFVIVELRKIKDN